MSATSAPETTPSAPPRFVDRHGGVHLLTPGHRDRLKPGWRRALLAEPEPRSDNEIRRELDDLASRLALAERIIQTCGGQLTGSRVLAVGCGDALEPVYLAGWGAASVVGIDHRQDTRQAENERLRRLAVAHLAASGRSNAQTVDAVDLLADDITASQLPDASFDLVGSWRTLEHIIDPEAAMREMFRVVRPGGLAYHEYNPFFGLDGGHALVTLDTPWGHVRLDAEDVGRYLRTCRPAEAERAMMYYHNHLNRMTIGQVSRAARSAGFEVVALVPRSRTEDLLEMTPQIFQAARRNYPAITLNDLVCRIVRVVLRRPAD